ncbi:recombinase RecA [Borreliella burgdorferi]|uniref:recombinase RecA n=1 Tax=Borreliella burgdorferi TaxID=139 RepID=UPI000D02DEE7|nr:recombinase RecA [Borreliella burgdorferi]PRR29062.1 recombinase RecA [Borreliella burgdorferi]PRR29817.1 recombinase RecA [Borreliella burgdorferi]PRR41308.1 recombinase RecA [Borreliella burgdorferi]
MSKLKEKREKAIVGIERSSKEEAIELARVQIEKAFGKGSLIKMGESPVGQGIKSMSSGSIVLDEALGIGGYPRGRIIEIFGPESSGKTTLTLQAIAEVQKEGGIAAFIDAEHALDPVYAKALGVNVAELWLSQPDTGEQALEIVEHLIRSGGVDLIVVDSVAALTPKLEIDGEMGDSQIGLQARLMSKALRKITGILSKSNTCIMFINQIRMRIGVMFGNPETTTGGNALKFYSSLRLEVRKIEQVTSSGSSDDVIGNKIRVKIVKNKVAPPFRKVELIIYFGKGISREAGILDAAIKHNLIQKTGSWYSLGDNKLGQGRESVIEYLSKEVELANNLDKRLRKIIFNNFDQENDNFIEFKEDESG